MALFTKTEYTNLEDLFLDSIRDLYDAEHRIVEALPKMADAASSQKLKDGFDLHLTQTQNQIARLDQVFTELNKKPERETCQAMKGLLEEGEDVVKAKGDRDVKDAALIAAAQRVEHYEIAAYGAAKTFAQHLGYNGLVNLLDQTLKEEKETDVALTKIAETNVNLRAMHAG